MRRREILISVTTPLFLTNSWNGRKTMPPSKLCLQLLVSTGRAGNEIFNSRVINPLFREEANQLRRAIKAEVEAIWQSDQMRANPILVEAEAKRVMERSNVIMDSYPGWVKFIKSLNKEAFWRYEASKACNDKAWRSKYIELSVRFFSFIAEAEQRPANFLQFLN